MFYSLDILQYASFSIAHDAIYHQIKVLEGSYHDIENDIFSVTFKEVK